MACHLNNRCEHLRKMKRPKKFDTFLYRHFKNNGHSPSKIVIQLDVKLYMIQIYQLYYKI